MTENKHESEETVEDTTARVEAATATDVDTETPGKHAAARRDRHGRGGRRRQRPVSTNALNPSARPIGRG